MTWTMGPCGIRMRTFEKEGEREFFLCSAASLFFLFDRWRRLRSEGASERALARFAPRRRPSAQFSLKAMSALFDFTAFLTVVLLTICTCTFVRMRAPGMLAERTG